MTEIPPIEKLKYPLGTFNFPRDQSRELTREWINVLKYFPKRLSEISSSLPEEKLTWKYRPQGWNIQQVIHHCADSHMNGIIRTKLALTETDPEIRPYMEARWAELEDYNYPIKYAIDTLELVHFKWALLFEKFRESDFEKRYYHPEDEKHYTLREQLALYAWHCNHHFAHIEQAISYEGKFNEIVQA
ncbi:MAG: YfiT family bacillithiol transferase [Bacteroidota bacterium]